MRTFVAFAAGILVLTGTVVWFWMTFQRAIDAREARLASLPLEEQLEARLETQERLVGAITGHSPAAVPDGDGPAPADPPAPAPPAVVARVDLDPDTGPALVPAWVAAAGIGGVVFLAGAIATVLVLIRPGPGEPEPELRREPAEPPA
ncbi:MAG: hypothetical protein ABMB14_03295 [Myxococcota bacterium]